MEVELSQFIAPLRKWWWLIVLSTLVATVSSYIATRQQVPFFQSTTTLMIGSAIDNPNPSGSDIYLTQQLAQTYVNFANRSSVREATMEALGLTNLPDIFVRTLPQTTFVEIAVTDTSPERAQAVAEELAHQLVLRSPTTQEEDQARQEFVNEQLNEYEKAIKETKTQIEQKNIQIGELISAREIADAQNEIATLESSLQSLQSNYASLLPSSQRGATNVIREIEPASLPTTPVDQKPEITILLSAAIGFVLAAAAAYLLEYLDDSINTPSMATKITGLPVLAGIARFGKRNGGTGIVTIDEPRSPISEAFRILRTSIQFSGVDDEVHTILVTSAVPGEGKSLTSANLAVVMAQAGNNVLLVDTDLRRPTQHRIFELPNKRGLTSLLLEYSKAGKDTDITALVKDAVQTAQATHVDGLHILPSGPIPPNPSELLGSPKMTGLLKSLKEQFDMVILDSSPVLSVTDAVVMSMQADRTLLVIRAGANKKEYAKQAAQRLRDSNSNLLGCVLNFLSPNSEGYGSYYYYKAPYYYGHDADGKEQTSKGITGKLKKLLPQQAAKE